MESVLTGKLDQVDAEPVGGTHCVPAQAEPACKGSHRGVAIVIRCLLIPLYCAILLLHPICRAAGAVIRKVRRILGRWSPDGLIVVGTFYNRGWCTAHLRPLAAAQLGPVTAVVDGPTQGMPGVTYAPVPRWLVKLFGRAGAKFIVALTIALRSPPRVVMGYHLLPGAMTALIVARLAGVRAVYQLTGGVTELAGGGAFAENFLLRRLGGPSRALERLALALSRRFDLLVVRGTSGLRFLMQSGLNRVRVITASVDPPFYGNGGERPIDVISVGRLVPIKQPHQVIEIIARLRDRVPHLKAAILGDGPLGPELQRLASACGVEDCTQFVGETEHVAACLRTAKTFVLTSQSEGLSIALAEAMAAGAVPVVADVGELRDLVVNGDTGWTISPGRLDQYVDRLADVLCDTELREQMSRAARHKACELSVEHVASRWSRAVRDVESQAGCNAKVAGRRVVPAIRRALWQRASGRLPSWTQSLVSRVPPTVWLGRSFRRNLRLLREAQWWSPEQTRQYQANKISDLLHLAYERSVHYRTSFDAVGFHPRDFQSPDDLMGLPTIDRDTIATACDDLCTSNVHRGVDYVSTGGTGGRPLAFLIGAERSAGEYAHLAASWARIGFDPDMALATFRGEPVPCDRHGVRQSFDPFLRRHRFSALHMSNSMMQGYLAAIAGIGPCFVMGYPSVMAMLARHLLHGKMPPPANVRGILLGSEAVYTEHRETVARAFGVPILSWYGLSEKVAFAAECEQSTDYHVWPTYGYVELLDNDGRPITTSGREGEIVATGFLNTAMPFIRYRTGDFATYAGERCAACGRQHMLLRNIRGRRIHEMLVARDGSLIPWTAVNVHDDTFDGVKQFQFVQDEPGIATLRVVPLNGFGPAAVNRIEQRITAKLSGRIAFRVELCEQVQQSRLGKSLYVVHTDEKLRSMATGNGHAGGSATP